MMNSTLRERLIGISGVGALTTLMLIIGTAVWAPFGGYEWNHSHPIIPPIVVVLGVGSLALFVFGACNKAKDDQKSTDNCQSSGEDQIKEQIEPWGHTLDEPQKVIKIVGPPHVFNQVNCEQNEPNYKAFHCRSHSIKAQAKGATKSNGLMHSRQSND
jgi:hypothetical protein